MYRPHQLLLTAITTGALAAGCAGTVGYTATVSNGGYGPDLVYVSPGVQVIADYDVPIFYADNFYWRFDGGTWYRSSYYTGGWVYAAPPLAVLRIERPHEYVHYRPHGWVDRRSRGPQPPIVRDHRDERPRFEQRPPGRQPPPMREAPPPRRSAPPPRESPPRHDNRPTNDRDHRQSH